MNTIYKYNYNAVNKLPFLNEEDFQGNITKIVIYDIFQSESSPPFLRFLLEKNIQGELDFLNLNSESFTIVNFIKTIFEKYHVTINPDVFQIAGACKLLSQYNDKGIDHYLFIDISHFALETIHSSITKSMVLIHEIINTKQMNNLKISENVSNFFIKHYEFAFIQNETNQDYEIPITGYVCKPLPKVEYTFVFGLTLDDRYQYRNQHQNSNSLYPNYYCLTDYEKAIQEMNNLKEEKEKKGIIRFALFTGKILLLENENENEKESDLLEIKEQYDYDCIQINNENESSNYLIKNIFQSIPLSYDLLNQ